MHRFASLSLQVATRGRSLNDPTQRKAVVDARVLACAVVIAFAANACGGSTTGPTPQPNNVDVTGTWQGSVRSSVSGATANISFTLTASGTSFTGDFACPFGCIHSSGTVSGTVTGTALTGRVTFPDGHSCGTFNGTVSGQTISGNYACTDPLGNDSGNWSTTRSGPLCTVSLSETAVTFERDGGTRSVNVQTSASSCTWQAVSDVSWLRITAGATGVGNGVVSYQVDAHTGTGVREGTISIGGQTLTVRQNPDVCRYCPSPSNRTVSSAGGTFSISVDPRDATTDWTAVSDQPSWLRITSGSSGHGRGTVTYVADQNTFSASRTGTISVGGLSGIFPRETHVVTQQPR